MDIPALATELSTARIELNIGIRVARKTLDIADEQGAAAVKLLESAAELARSTTEAEAGGGGRLDVVA